MSDLVGNPEDRFSHNEALMLKAYDSAELSNLICPPCLFQLAQPFFKFMSMLVEFVGGPPGMPPFTQYILQRYWDVS